METVLFRKLCGSLPPCLLRSRRYGEQNLRCTGLYQEVSIVILPHGFPGGKAMAMISLVVVSGGGQAGGDGLAIKGVGKPQRHFPRQGAGHLAFPVFLRGGRTGRPLWRCPADWQGC